MITTVVFRLRQNWQQLSILFIGVLAPLYLFGSFADEVVEKEIFFFDKPLLLWLHQHANTALDHVMLFFTHAGSALTLVPLNCAVVAYLAWRGQRINAHFLILAVGGAALLNFLAKHAFARVRPNFWVSIAPETTFSFPSGHAMTSMAAFAVLMTLTWHSRWRWPITIVGACFVGLVGLSRLYLGVHFPSDVLAGWSASLAWVTGLHVLRKHIESPKPTSVLDHNAQQ